MAITAYCKKCQEDVPLGERCPHCGGKLAKSSARVAWCVTHTPVEDWLCWNSVARIFLPAWLVVLLAILLPEGITGGVAALEQVLTGVVMLSMVLLLLLGALATLLVLHLQGDDLIDCVVDSKGVHVRRFLPSPTPLKLLLRLKSPRLIREMEDGEDAVLISTRDLPWKSMARVQLWPEKRLVLIYAPHWWMNLALYCTPFTWEDTLAYMRDKVGRKKDLLLPRELMAPPKPKAPRKPKAAPAADLPDTPAEAPSQAAAPQEASSQEDTWQEALPFEASPQEVLPQEALPQEALPQEAPLQEASLQEALPQEAFLQEKIHQPGISSSPREDSPEESPVSPEMWEGQTDFFDLMEQKDE